MVRTEGIVEFPLRLVYHFLYSEQGRNSWDEASNRKMGTRHDILPHDGGSLDVIKVTVGDTTDKTQTSFAYKSARWACLVSKETGAVVVVHAPLPEACTVAAPSNLTKPPTVGNGVMHQCGYLLRPVDGQPDHTRVSMFSQCESPSGYSSTLAVEEATKALERVCELFREADKDGSNALELKELTAVIQTVYKDQGVGRSAKKIEAEIERLMVRKALILDKCMYDDTFV